MYGAKFAFQNRLGKPYFWKKIYCFSLSYFVPQDNFQVQAPPPGGGLFSKFYSILYNAALDYLYTYKFSNVIVLANVFHVDNNMGSCSGKEELVESKTRYQIFLCLLSSYLLFLFPQYRVLQYVLWSLE